MFHLRSPACECILLYNVYLYRLLIYGLLIVCRCGVRSAGYVGLPRAGAMPPCPLAVAVLPPLPHALRNGKF